jgi:biopolymer transport protein ExbD
MITLQMIPDKGLNLQLPAYSQAKQLPRPHYTLAGLQQMLAADKAVPFQNFIHVMDACQKAGVSVIGIAAKASP